MIDTSTIPQKPAKRFLNTESLIQYCRDTYDLPLSKATIYRAQRAGMLYPIKHGGRLLFPVTDVQRWIEGFSAGEEQP